MKRIASKNMVFASLFGEQSVVGGELKLASYCSVVPCDDGVLLYNSLSQELLLLSKEEYNTVCDLNSADSKILDYLKKGWFYIPVSVNDNDYCDQMRSTAKMMKKPNKAKCYNSFTIMTTLECNARCFYCFQHGRMQPRMSPQTALDVAKFMIDNHDSDKEISIQWFGGEPLFNEEAIDIISTELEKAGVEFTAKIITNGYLFSVTLLEKAKKLWHIERVQITLDGTENVYNRSKNYIYKDVESPFKTVLSNIEWLLQNDFKVLIRLNLGLHNADDLFELVDFLAEKFGKYKNFMVYSHRLLDYDEFGKQLHKPEEIIDTINVFNKFNRTLVEKDLQQGKGLPTTYRTNYCMADLDTTLVISPEGKLTKCEHFSDSEIIGDVYSGVANDALVSEWKLLQPKLDICNDCAAYMNCYRLKKCPDISPECTIHEKQEQEKKLGGRVLNTYKSWKARNK